MCSLYTRVGVVPKEGFAQFYSFIQTTKKVLLFH